MSHKRTAQGLPALESAIGRKVVARIGSNEAFALPTHPLADILPPELLDLCRLYPDPYSRAMREKLAALAPGAVADASHVVVDSGADGLIFLALRTRIVPGDTVVTSAGTYPTFGYFAQGLGANIVEVPSHSRPSPPHPCAQPQPVRHRRAPSSSPPHGPPRLTTRTIHTDCVLTLPPWRRQRTPTRPRLSTSRIRITQRALCIPPPRSLSYVRRCRQSLRYPMPPYVFCTRSSRPSCNG